MNEILRKIETDASNINIIRNTSAEMVRIALSESKKKLTDIIKTIKPQT